MNEVYNERLLTERGYRKYAGEGIDVFYSIDVCEHVGNCVKGSMEVFDPKRKPWVLPNAKPADEVARIVNTCPTGALKFIMKEGSLMDYTIEKNRVTATENGEEYGEMTFVDSGSFYIIDHTGVYDNARGKGVGKGMVATFVEHARAEGKHVLPLCPFAKAEFEKNPDYADVLKS